MNRAEFRFALLKLAQQWREEQRDLGWQAATHLALARCFSTAPLVRLKLPGYPQPVFLRLGSSDVLVLRQVLGRQEYRHVAQLPHVKRILDLGGNIGLASFYLKQYYPEAEIIFVEPDEGNLAVARRTLAPFRKQIHFVCAGVWDTETALVVERGMYRDGGEWAFQVRAARAGEPGEIYGTTIDLLLSRTGWDSVDLVKMDIEGSEAVILRAANVSDWMRKTRCLAVELHGENCAAALHQALAAAPSASTTTHGETTVILFAESSRQPDTRKTSP